LARLERGAALPTCYFSFKLEITFCIRGVIGDPCGVPRPSSRFRGAGYYVVMERHNEHWIIEKEINVWVS
jgi:hypothetical protein